MLNKLAEFIGTFSYKHRKLISIFAVILFVAVIIGESFSTISFHYSEENLVTEIFPTDDTLVIVYDNRDENAIQQFINNLEQNEKVLSVQAYGNTLGKPLNAHEMATNFGLDPLLAGTLFTMYGTNMSQATITLQEFATFVGSSEFNNNAMIIEMMGTEQMKQLEQFNKIVSALDSDEAISAEEIADIFGVDVNIVKTIMFISQFQTQSIKFSEFVNTITTISDRLGSIVDEELLSQLKVLQEMSVLVKNHTALTANDMYGLLSGSSDSDMLTPDTLLLFIAMVKSTQINLDEVRVPLYDMFVFLSEEFLKNPTYSSFISDEMQEEFSNASKMIEDGKSQLVGPDHSRLIVTTSYKPETDGIYSFHENINHTLDEMLLHDFYIVGESALSAEVRNTFTEEYTFISILTAISVLIVVCISFKSFFLPVLLVAVIECSVFSMMSVMAIINHSMFFIALILVQCILMGSMIDYAILLTNYYVEVRRELPKERALPEVMKRSMHAIITSGSIMVIVAFICGTLMEGQVASILVTLGIGALCALILILFVLPALLAVFDKQVTAKWILPVIVNDSVPSELECDESYVDPNQLTFDDVLPQPIVPEAYQDAN